MKKFFFLLFMFISFQSQAQTDSTKYLLLSDGAFSGGVSEVYKEGFWYKVIGDTQTAKGSLVIIDSLRFAIISKNETKVDTFNINEPRIYTVNLKEREIKVAGTILMGYAFGHGLSLIYPEIRIGRTKGLGFAILAIGTFAAGGSLLILAAYELSVITFGTELYGKRMQIVEVPKDLMETRFAVWNYLRKKRKGKL